MSKRFRVCSLEQEFLLPPSLQDWLPEDHLARFMADVVNELDLSAIYAEYERKDGRGLSAYHPLMMTRLLLYGYCIGITSSRKIEKATYDNLAFRYLSADQHPDHDTLAAFRQEHLEALASLFVQALRLCQKAGLVKLGNVAIDGTKIKANASTHRSGCPPSLPFPPYAVLQHGFVSLSTPSVLLQHTSCHRIASLHGTPNGVRGRDCRLAGRITVERAIME